MIQRTIEDIAEALGSGGATTRRCSVIVGAGCSVSAGIPSASEMILQIKSKYPIAYERAEAKNYPDCMAALERGVRRSLIGAYIDNAKINWAHIALAQLIDNGHVDRVLTTNFDPLISRACALVNSFPVVYDFAASHVFNPDQVSEKAIFHLHGQRDGFVLLNTSSEVTKHRNHLKPVFDEADKGRIWIVVGYSGEKILFLICSPNAHQMCLVAHQFDAGHGRRVQRRARAAIPSCRDQPRFNRTWIACVVRGRISQCHCSILRG